MILGVGADLCAVERMSGLLGDGAFLRRYFHPSEQAYIASRGAFAAASMAGCFAAKEAYAKALGSGFGAVRPEDIVVLHRENGAPYYEVTGSALAAARGAGVRTAHLSITHDGGLALAFAVLEGEQREDHPDA